MKKIPRPTPIGLKVFEIYSGDNKMKRKAQSNKCRFCGKPVRISMESFEYTEEDGYCHLKCLKKEKGIVEL